MARMDLRVRAWGWMTRRQASVAARSEEDVIAMQRRGMPESRVTDLIFGKTPPGVAVTNRSVPGPDGDIPVRVYRPVRSAAGPRPLVVYYHGGGFVFGYLRMGDWLCGQVASRVGAVVVSVDYRLAPVHRFPAAVEDSYAALSWVAANSAGEVGAGGPLGVMGESAGGTLSAVMCLLARERGGPAISHQALIYPATDMTAERENVQMPFLSSDEMAAYRRMYLGPDGDPANPWASPLLAKDQEGLPPALIQVAETACGTPPPCARRGCRYALPSTSACRTAS